MRIAPKTQGVFYLATGLWPIVHLRSFEGVTGKKADGWLAQTAGGLIAAVGLALLVENSKLLGIASAAALGLADVIFAGKRRISPVYFADAAVEAALVAGWLAER
jgi:hypothetical protein